MMNLIERRRWYFRTVAGSGGIDYLLRVEFATDDAAPVTSPYVGEVGDLNIVDPDEVISVSGGSMDFGLVSTAHSYVYSDAITRAEGVVGVIESINPGGNQIFGFDLVGGSYVNGVNGYLGQILNAISYRNQDTTVSLPVNTAGTVKFITVLHTTGADIYIVDADSASPRFQWRNKTGTDSTLYLKVGMASFNFPSTIDLPRVAVARLGGTLASGATAIQSVDVDNPVSGTNQTATADGLHEIVFTLDGSPTAGETVELQYRVQDASNYWTAFIERNGGNTAWDAQLDSVSAGTPTNRISVAGISSSTTDLRVLVEGSKHYLYTKDTQWRYRGTTTVSHLNTETAINATYDAGNTVTELNSIPRTSANYDQLGDI